MFLRNCWYVAGWSREFGRELSRRTLLGEDLVLFRRQDGSPAALQNACPHRRLPLSMGTLEGDAVVCGYHGLTFDGTGACVDAPTQRGAIPRRARVRSWPVVDRYDLLWIWAGDPEDADPALILEIENWDDPGWGRTEGGSMELGCNYLWMVDNLLDPSHVAWVHVSSFGGGGTDDGPLDIDQTEEGVVVSRWILGRPPSPYYAGLVKFDGPCDRLQHYEMRPPAIGLNKSVYTPAGTGGPGMTPVDLTYVNISYNFMTPIDADRTLYIWFQHRNTDPHDRAISETMNAGARMAFEEDRVVLEAVHAGMKAAPGPALDLGLDAGAKLFRRRLGRMIEAEGEVRTAEV